MKVIEGFHVQKIKRGTKKGELYINYSKRYIWKIPEHLEGQIDKGDIVFVHSKKDNRDIRTRVLVLNILENTESNFRSVIEIDKKGVSEK
ncbi:MAG: DUF5839 family protein [Aeromonas sp.]